ncbi:hypothetical protein [Streptomyces daliensis]
MRINPIRTAVAAAVVTTAALGTMVASGAAAGATGVTGTTGSAGAVGAAGSGARVAAAPGFLDAGELPPHSSSPWFAGTVTKGLPDPEPFCLEGAVPAGGGTYHRFFGTDYDTHAAQVSVVASSVTAAKALATSLEKKVAACAADWLRETPGGSASWDDYGTVAAGDSAHVYGVHTSIPESEPGVNLFAVGRDGKTVTVVRWAEMGHLDQAPLAAFKKTTATAVNKLN